MKKDMTSIVLVHYTQPLGQEILSIELRSIFAFTPPENFEVILVDNSQGDLPEWVVERLDKGESNFQRIFNSINSGWVEGCNQGIDAANGEFIVLMNNDVVVPLKWLGILKNVYLSGMRNNFRVGTVGPQAVFADHAQDLRTHPLFMNPTVSPTMTHFCAFFHREVFDNIGKLDPAFSKVDGYFSDDDLNLRLAQHGYTNLIAPIAMLHLKPHFHRGEYESRCKEIFEVTGPAIFREKWGGIGDYWLKNRQLPGVRDDPKAKNNDPGISIP